MTVAVNIFEALFYEFTSASWSVWATIQSNCILLHNQIHIQIQSTWEYVDSAKLLYMYIIYHESVGYSILNIAHL